MTQKCFKIKGSENNGISICSTWRCNRSDGKICHKPYPGKNRVSVLTLITNILGAILIGFIVGIASSNENIPENVILFLKTGICGGFTTFSTFSLETYNLFEGKQYAMGSVYVALSCLGCILGVLCGKKLAGVMRS